MHPLRADIPIMLGAEGPKNVALAAEIADGWLPMFFSPKTDGFYRDALAEGFARRGARHTLDDFEVAAFVPVIIDDDVEAAADLVRPSLALYIGGMGAKTMNFHADVFARMGYEAEVAKIQELYPRRPQGRGDRRGPDRPGRGRRPGRPGREDPRRARGVAADGDHDAARADRPAPAARRSPSLSAEALTAPATSVDC